MPISSLGIGSGVLTADVIDQLKAADSSRIVAPIETKIAVNVQEQEAAELLSTLMTTLKSSASSLSLGTLFDNVTVTSSGNVDVEVESGASIESFTLETTTLAKKDIISIGSFASKSDTVATGSGVLLISGNEVAYDNTTTLSELSQSITDAAEGDVSVSILETSSGAFSLILTSSATGADQAITISDTDDGSTGTGTLGNLFSAYDAATNTTGYQQIQDASDSSFIYNGITITRDTNEVTDLIVGVTINLKEEGDSSSVDVKLDTAGLVTEMELFVSSYTALISNLKDMTVFDEATNAKGIFNTNSFVKSIEADINDTVTSINSQYNSLFEYGIDIDRYGTMSFDSSVLISALEEDSSSVELFFSGGTNSDGNEVTGLFETINDKIDSYTGFNELLSYFEADLKTSETNLTDAYDRAVESLDNRYEIMSKRFSAYDAIINRLNNEFASLQLIIEGDNDN